MPEPQHPYQHSAPDFPGLEYDLGDLSDKMTSSLSERQNLVLAWVAAGATNDCIAKEIGFGIKTVEADLTAIYSMLGVSGRIQAAVVWALITATYRQTHK